MNEEREDYVVGIAAEVNRLCKQRDEAELLAAEILITLVDNYDQGAIRLQTEDGSVARMFEGCVAQWAQRLAELGTARSAPLRRAVSRLEFARLRDVPRCGHVPGRELWC